MAAEATTRPLTKFGYYLKDLLAAAGYERVYAFARDVGISHANLGKWMDGSATPSVDGLRRTAERLGVDLLDLIVAAEILTPAEAHRNKTTTHAAGPPMPAVLRSILSRLASPRYKQRHKDVLLTFVQDDVDRWDGMIEQIEQERAEALRGRR